VLRHSNGTVTIEYSNIALFVSALLLAVWNGVDFLTYYVQFLKTQQEKALPLVKFTIDHELALPLPASLWVM